MRPYTFTLYMGIFEEEMNLLVNNIIDEKIFVYALPVSESGLLYRKVVKHYTNGDTDESEIRVTKVIGRL